MTQSENDSCPFRRAEPGRGRVKIFMWGDTGTGKTPLALQFPAPTVLDCEHGTDPYADSCVFHVTHPRTPDEVETAIKWLLSNTHDFKTCIIDPWSVYWESVQEGWVDKFLRQRGGTEGHKEEFYDVQPRDWVHIKRGTKRLFRLLVALDMNVIVTARSKAEYARGGGEFMKKIGDTFDGDRSLPYWFDIHLQTSRWENGTYHARVIRDRNRVIKDQEFMIAAADGDFSLGYRHFQHLFSDEVLTRPAEPTPLATAEQKEEMQEYFRALELPADGIARRLAAYNADTLADLTARSAETILEKLRDAVHRREVAATAQTGEEN